MYLSLLLPLLLLLLMLLRWCVASANQDHVMSRATPALIPSPLPRCDGQTARPGLPDGQVAVYE